MPKNCPLNKKDSHACWDCLFNFGDSCTYETNISAKEVIQQHLNNIECTKCSHFTVCSRLMGGMNLDRCEDYKEELVARWKTREKKNDFLWVECSNCGFIVENYKAVNLGKSSTDVIGYKWHACPRCTAKMVMEDLNVQKC